MQNWNSHRFNCSLKMVLGPAILDRCGFRHLWSSGYDVSLTRWRSPVRSWPGVFHLSQSQHWQNVDEIVFALQTSKNRNCACSLQVLSITSSIVLLSPLLHAAAVMHWEQQQISERHAAVAMQWEQHKPPREHCANSVNWCSWTIKAANP